LSIGGTPILQFVLRCLQHICYVPLTSTLPQCYRIKPYKSIVLMKVQSCYPIGLGLGLFRLPSILYKVVDHKDIEIVKYIKSVQDPNVNC